MSDYCRALFNDTSASKPYMYELQCTRNKVLNVDGDDVCSSGSECSYVVEITNFPTWTTSFADKEITMYFRATASPSVIPGAAGDGAGFLYMDPTETT